MSPLYGNAPCIGCVFYGLLFVAGTLCALPSRGWSEDVSWLGEVNRPPSKITAERLGNVEPLLMDKTGQRIQSIAGWEHRREEIRAAWMKFLGPMPQHRPPVRIKTMETNEADGFTRELIRYEGEPGLFDDGYILRPKKSEFARQGRLPGLIALHQTARTSIDEIAGINGRPMQQLGALLARRGFVVFCPRNFLWKSTNGFDPRDALRAHRQRHPKTLGMRKMLYDAMRAVDVLTNLKDVDAERIGAVGHSLGGKEVLYLLPFDERVKGGVASEGGLLLRSTNWHDPLYLGDAIDDEAFPLNHHQLLALAAPRPLLVVAGGKADSSVNWALLRPAQEVYSLYGTSIRLGQYNHGQRHRIPVPAFVRLQEWLVQYVALREERTGAQPIRHGASRVGRPVTTHESRH